MTYRSIFAEWFQMFHCAAPRALINWQFRESLEQLLEDEVPARTLRSAVMLSGVGLHSGTHVKLQILPCTSGGIIFVRTDLPGSPAVSAGDVDPNAPPFRTALRCGAAEIHTVEHLMAAFAALGISDCRIELSGPEVPGMDGSAVEFVEAIRSAGVVEIESRRIAPVVVAETVVIEEGIATLRAYPHIAGLKVTYTLNYPGEPLAQGKYELDIDENSFVSEIARARTFVMRKDAEKMLAAGFGKGANCQNTVVIDGDKIVDTTLRFPDEPVRHKILDLIGDLYVLGRPIRGHIVANCSGHRANRLLAMRLKQ